MRQWLSVCLVLACLAPAAAQKVERIERTSPNHTTIVIHDRSSEAVQRRRELAQQALDRRAARRAKEPTQPVATQVVDTQAQGSPHPDTRFEPSPYSGAVYGGVGLNTGFYQPGFVLAGQGFRNRGFRARGFRRFRGCRY